MSKKKLSPDRQKQVDTMKKRHGEDFYSKMGRKGGAAISKLNTSEKGRLAAQKRWAKHNAEKAKREKGGDSEQKGSN